jgi:hypothetical protein
LDLLEEPFVQEFKFRFNLLRRCRVFYLLDDNLITFKWLFIEFNQDVHAFPLGLGIDALHSKIKSLSGWIHRLINCLVFLITIFTLTSLPLTTFQGLEKWLRFLKSRARILSLNLKEDPFNYKTQLLLEALLDRLLVIGLIIVNKLEVSQFRASPCHSI